MLFSFFFTLVKSLFGKINCKFINSFFLSITWLGFIPILIVFTVLIFFNLLNKRRRNSQNNESKKEDKIVDLEKDPVTKEYKPKE